MTIALVVLVLILALLAYAATRPAVFRVERSATIMAPPEKIFPLLHDFHAWAAWSPYEKLDPTMKKTYGGAPSGPGAVYEWDGNGKAGKGRMEILSTTPPSHVHLKLDFEKPFEGHNLTDFTLEPDGESTRVTWSMHGPNAFMSKLMGIFMNLEKLVGRDFESGLANLKAAAER